jgi:hypothetical protein
MNIGIIILLIRNFKNIVYATAINVSLSGRAFFSPAL